VLDPEIRAYYDRGEEDGRLGDLSLERIRTEELLLRHLPPAPAFTVAEGDARALEEPDASCDAVLLLGPLYHLVERDDRLQAVREAARVVRPGGVVAAAAISRAASLIDGVGRGFIADPEFQTVVAADLADGAHRNPTRRPGWFTTAWFHWPEELDDELREAGLDDVEVVGVEEPGDWFRDRFGDDVEPALVAARLAERDPRLRILSAHLLGIGRRPG
jgi:SAM-dependent methyltransferase